MDPRIVPLPRPLITEPEQVPAIKPFNMQMKVLLTTEDTAGAVSVIMAWHKPGEGPPDHVHFDQEETFFIVDGRYELTIDGQTSIDGPGTLVFIPRNIVHSFKNVGETSACMRSTACRGYPCCSSSPSVRSSNTPGVQSRR
jgi:quercetin dioxygenase-like cupin family protein